MSICANKVSCLFVVVFVVSSRLSIMRDLKKLIDTHFVRTLKRRPGTLLKKLNDCCNLSLLRLLLFSYHRSSVEWKSKLKVIEITEKS